MVNTNMFHHPKYYKELRKRNTAVQSSRTDSQQSDQAISEQASTEVSSVRPGPGLKQQAIDETVPHNDIEEAQASSGKPQAASNKLQSLKLQATSIKP